MPTPSVAELAKMIDHSLLHPTMTDDDLREGCLLAKAYDVASVCIKPYAVPLAASLLQGSGVLVGTVVGFPHGSSALAAKLLETEQACKEGAAEIDMVVNVGKVLSNDWGYVEYEIAEINQRCLKHGAILKVIFENDFLPNDSYKIGLCGACNKVGVAFAKTSTGYGFVKQPSGGYNYAGATEADLKLMRQYCAPHIQIKAAGGVRSLADLLRVRALGVTRVGATATAAILEAAKNPGETGPAATTTGGY